MPATVLWSLDNAQIGCYGVRFRESEHSGEITLFYANAV